VYFRWRQASEDAAVLVTVPQCRYTVEVKGADGGHRLGDHRGLRIELVTV